MGVVARESMVNKRWAGRQVPPAGGRAAAGAPAAFDALVTALGEFGTKSLAEVVEPAYELADAGFPMHVGMSGTGHEGQFYARAGASIRQNAERFLTKCPSSGRLAISQNEHRPAAPPPTHT